MPHIQSKTALLKARVSNQLKAAVDRVVKARGESEAVIIREAVTYYLSVLERRKTRGIHPRVPGGAEAPSKTSIHPLMAAALAGFLLLGSVKGTFQHQVKQYLSCSRVSAALVTDRAPRNL